MSPSEVDWIPALIVLVLGFVAGSFVLWRLRGRLLPQTTADETRPATLVDLELRRETLLRELRELVDTGTKRTAAQLQQERYALELEAARVLREIDARQAHAEAETTAATPAPKAKPAAAGAGTSAVKGFLWGVGSVTAVGLLLFLASRSTEQRGPSSSGMSQTGGAAGPAQPANDQVSDADLARLKAAVDTQPDNIEARIELAAAHLRRNEMMPVFEQTRFVLQKEPNNPRALTYQAVVRLAMGEAPQAESMLKRALQQAPDLADAHIYLMLTYTELGRDQDAETALAAAARRLPDHAEALRGLLAQMRQERASRPQAANAVSGAANPHASLDSDTAATGAVPTPGPLPGAAPPPPSAASGMMPGAAAPFASASGPASGGAGSSSSISGTIELDGAARSRVAPGETIFLMLRPVGVEAGPPLAVKRLTASSFPMSFEIGSADSMTGAPIPDRVLVEARADEDGNPMTRSPDDPLGEVNGVQSGARNVRIVLTVRR